MHMVVQRHIGSGRDVMCRSSCVDDAARGGLAMDLNIGLFEIPPRLARASTPGRKQFLSSAEARSGRPRKRTPRQTSESPIQMARVIKNHVFGLTSDGRRRPHLPGASDGAAAHLRAPLAGQLGGFLGQVDRS